MREIRVLISTCLRDPRAMEKYGSLVTDYLYTQARMEQLENSFRLRNASTPVRKWGHVFSLWNVRVAIFGRIFKKPSAPAPSPAPSAPSEPAPSAPVFQAPSAPSEPAPSEPAPSEPAPSAPAPSAPAPSAPAPSAPSSPEPEQEEQEEIEEEIDEEQKQKEEEQKAKQAQQLEELNSILREYYNTSDGHARRRIVMRLKGFFNTDELKGVLAEIQKKWSEESKTLLFDKSGKDSKDGKSLSYYKKLPDKKPYIRIVMFHYLRPLLGALERHIKSGQYLEMQQEETAKRTKRPKLTEEQKVEKNLEYYEKKLKRDKEKTEKFIDGYLERYGDGLSAETVAKIKGADWKTKNKLRKGILQSAKKKQPEPSFEANDAGLPTQSYADWDF